MTNKPTEEQVDKAAAHLAVLTASVRPSPGDRWQARCILTVLANYGQITLTHEQHNLAIDMGEEYPSSYAGSATLEPDPGLDGEHRRMKKALETIAFHASQQGGRVGCQGTVFHEILRLCNEGLGE